MKKKILILEPENFPPKAKNLFESNGFEVCIKSKNDDLSRYSDIQHLFIRLGYFIDNEFVRHFKYLKSIISPTTGQTHIANEVAEKYPIIKIDETDPFINDITPTAEHAILLALIAQRNIKYVFKSLKNKFERPDSSKGTMQDKKVLIFGNGRIGGHIKRLILPFTNKIPVMYDISPEKSDINYDQMIKQISDFDIIFLSLKYRDKEVITKNMIQKISNDCTLVNISRGELINEKAVLEKVKTNKNFFYCTDVLNNEHLYSENELFKKSRYYTNIILTPHIGGYCKSSLAYIEYNITKKFLELT